MAGVLKSNNITDEALRPFVQVLEMITTCCWDVIRQKTRPLLCPPHSESETEADGKMTILAVVERALWNQL